MDTTLPVQKRSLRAQFKKVLPLTYDIVKYGGTATAAFSIGVGGLSALPVIATGSATIALITGATTAAAFFAGFGLQGFLPVAFLSSMGEGFFRYTRKSPKRRPEQPTAL